MWFAFANEPDELHIIPQDDLIDHTVDESCICGPIIDCILDKYLPDGLRLIMHVSLDGREFAKTDGKIRWQD